MKVNILDHDMTQLKFLDKVKYGTRFHVCFFFFLPI